MIYRRARKSKIRSRRGIGVDGPAHRFVVAVRTPPPDHMEFPPITSPQDPDIQELPLLEGMAMDPPIELSHNPDMQVLVATKGLLILPPPSIGPPDMPELPTLPPEPPKEMGTQGKSVVIYPPNEPPMLLSHDLDMQELPLAISVAGYPPDEPLPMRLPHDPNMQRLVAAEGEGMDGNAPPWLPPLIEFLPQLRSVVVDTPADTVEDGVDLPSKLPPLVVEPPSDR